MPSIFNDFVDAMVSGQPLDEELFQELWSALRGMLRSEMQRRGVWQTRPSFLGVVGYTRWNEGGESQGPLDELTSDCFEYVFVRRLNGLERQARTKDSIDGLIRLAVRQFLLAVQSQHDPLGFRVFEVVSASLLQALREERLVCIAGSPRMRNETCLARLESTSVDQVRHVDVEPLIDLWADQRLEPMVEASHQALKDLKRDLIVDVEEFLGKDRPGFRFGNLVGPLKERVRRSWAARFLNLPGFLNVAAEDEIDPDWVIEDLLALREHVAAVVRCVDQAGSPAKKAKVRRYFAMLWGYLKGYAFEDVRRWIQDGAAQVDEAESDVPESDVPESLPSARQLAELLGIPRARLPELFEHLKARWKDCEEWANTADKELAMSKDTPEESAFEGAQGRAWALAQQRREAATGPREAASAEATWLRPGDLFEVPGTDMKGVIWGVVSRGADGAELTCCPIDTASLVEVGDVDLSWSGSEDEPYVVRLGLSMEVPSASLGRVRRAGQLSPEGLEAVLEETVPERSLEERRLDWLPSYRDWMEEGPLASRIALGRHLAGADRVVEGTGKAETATPSKSKRWALWPLVAVAAGLLFMVSGGSWQFWDQTKALRQQVAELEGRVVELQEDVAHWKAPVFQYGQDELSMGQDVRGEVTLKVADDDRFYELVMIANEFYDYRSVRIEGVAADGSVLFTSKALPPAVEYKVLLPVDLLENGSIELRLVGLRGDQATVLEEGVVHRVDVESRP